MTQLYFEDAEIGMTSKAGPYLVSKEEIVQFAKQYDPAPRHLDEEAAARSIFWRTNRIERPYVFDLHLAHAEAPASAPCPRRNGLG